MDPAHNEQRRLAAIMFTDMVGYSALAARHESLALELLQEHRQLLRDIFARFQGREVETTGDGFLVEFGSAVDATRCAIEMQRALASRNAAMPPARQVQIRIGVHAGDIVHKGRDLLGDGVNVAARLYPLAKPGGICISRTVCEQIQNKGNWIFESGGDLILKNLGRPIEVFHWVGGSEGNRSTEPADGPPPAAAASIAVLPFVNMSDDRENEFLSDGITEDLIAALSQVKDLRVPARTSAFAFKGKHEDIRHIGQVLNVRNVLEGSVRKSGNRLRITAQLISVSDGYHLWSERFDREMVDVFAIQDEITRAIVEALKPELIGPASPPLVRAPTTNTDAYQLYLQGRSSLYQRGIGMSKALHYFHLALLEDPDYALAESGLADTHFLLAFYGFTPAAQAVPQAVAASEKAFRLAPDSTEVRVSLATVKGWCCWDFDATFALYRQAIETNPGYSQGRAWYGSFLSALGRHEEATAQHRQAIEFDPLSPYLNSIYGWGLIHRGRLAEALQPLGRALELAPDYPLARRLLGQAYVGLRRYADGIAELTKAAESVRRAGWVLAYLGYALARNGQEQAARDVLRELTHSGCPYVPARSLAVVHAGLDDAAAALNSLEKAYEERDVQLIWLNVEPAFAELRDEPRFQALSRKLRLSA